MMKQKKTLVSRGIYAILGFFLLSLSGCPSYLQDSAEPQINYYSRAVDYGRFYYRNTGGFSVFLPQFTLIYDLHGKLEGRVETEYFSDPQMEDLPKWTRVYRYEDEVFRLEYRYRYHYKPCYYWIAGEDGEFEVMEQLLTRGEVYFPGDGEGNPSFWYEVEYVEFKDAATGKKYQPDRYRTVKDYERGNPNPIAWQVSTYAEIPAASGYYEYVTEKYYDIAPNDTIPSLSKEFASWYDANGRYTYELYHPVRTYDTDVYYYTKYDWNAQNMVYLQQDFVYTGGPDAAYVRTDKSFADENDAGVFGEAGAAGSPPPNAGGIMQTTGTYTHIYDYPLEFPKIGERREALEYFYDTNGRITTSLRTTLGSEVERRNFQYSGDEISSEITYVNGGSKPYDRREVRFSERAVDNVLYQVREELLFRDYETAAAGGNDAYELDGRSAFPGAPHGRSASSGTLKYFGQSKYRPIRNNHER